MELIKVAEKIDNKIRQLTDLRNEIESVGEKMVNSSAEYDKEIAVTLMKLKNGISFELDGQTILDPPTTIIEKIARGICWQKKLEMEKSEMIYKSLLQKVDICKAQLMGLQSINKYLSEMEGEHGTS